VAKDPLASLFDRMTCIGDRRDWTVESLILAEESGVTQADVAEMKTGADPSVLRLLG